MSEDHKEQENAEEGAVESPIQESNLKDQDPKQEEPAEKTVEQERDEYLAGWQRAQADLQNLKKQHAEERSVFTTLGKEALLQDLIPMLDNFDAAFSNKEVWESVDQNWRVGIEYIYKQFHETLKQHGVEAFASEGEIFDTLLHEPVETVATKDDKEKGAIVKVMQKGYKIGERVIRPAKVKVGE